MAFIIKNWESKNGARIYFIRRNELPIVDITVLFAAGSAYDGEAQGISNMVNHMLNQGTKKLTDIEIADGFEKIGAQFYSTSDRDKALISLRSLSQQKYLNPALKIFTEILESPAFKKQTFLRTQKLIQNAIQHQGQSPESLARKALYAAIYNHHPYAHPVLGTLDSVSVLSTDHLKKFHKKYYVANNAIIILVGDLTQKNAESLANRLAESLPRGQRAEEIIRAGFPSGYTDQRIAFPSQQTHIVFGQIGIHYHDPNYFNLLLANYILGGAPLISRLFKVIREQHGLAYSASSILTPLQAKGLWAIIMQTRRAKANAALKLTNAIVTQFVEHGPTSAELTMAKKMIINSFPLSLARNDDIMRLLINIGYYQLPNDYCNVFIEKIKSATLNQVKNALATSRLDQATKILVGS